MEQFDTIILTVPNDFKRLQPLYPKLGENLESPDIYFIGCPEVGELIEKACYGERFRFIDEDTIIPFQKVHEIIKEILEDDNVPRNVTGWYYQQFLKMEYARVTKDSYYLAWDGDTIPIRKVKMFENGKPLFDWKREYEEEYFITISQLFPDLRKIVEMSFISEHMLFHTRIMGKMLGDIEKNTCLKGKTFYEKILRTIGKERLKKNSFSEFETYGTYCGVYFPEQYRLRRWTSYRHCGQYFSPDDITDREIEWLSKDFDAISFEKGHMPEPGYEFMRNPEYQEKLSARRIVEIIQDELLEDSYKESWE